MASDNFFGFTMPEPEQERMDERQLALRRLFVAEYLKDYNPNAAAMRCGFGRAFAAEAAQKFLAEPYVQRLLSDMQLNVPEDQEKELSKYNQTRIKQGLMREAHYHGPGSSHAARVAALRGLAVLEGMEAPKKVELSATNRGGVMAVPGIASLDAWEKEAVASQDALVAHARQ